MLLLSILAAVEMKEYVNNNVRIRTIKRISNETDRRDDRGYRCASWCGITASAAGDAECRDSSGDVEVGETTIELETPYSARDVAALADFSHNPADQAAIISSGSFRTDGMIVIPCSMKRSPVSALVTPMAW